MNCYYCNQPAIGICQHCGVGVCAEHSVKAAGLVAFNSVFQVLFYSVYA